MGRVDARNGIFDVLLTMTCSYLATKVVESKFTDEIIEGWDVATHSPSSYVSDVELLKMLAQASFGLSR